MKRLLLTAAFALPFAITAQVTVASENFDSYADGDSISVVGASNGWTTWGGVSGTTEEGYVSTTFSNSGPNSGRFSNTDTTDAHASSDMIMAWSDATAGRFEIGYSVYLDNTSGIAGGYLGIGDAGMNETPNYLYFYGDSLDLDGTSGGFRAGLGVDGWHAIRIVIDIDNATTDLWVDGTNVGQVANTFAATGLGAIDCWATSWSFVVSDYIPGQYYLDDIYVWDITNGSAGIEENTITSSIYPNPASDILTIESNQEIKNITIISLDGKVVLNESANGMTTQVTVSSLIQGSYVVEMTTVNGTIVKNTFVKK